MSRLPAAGPAGPTTASRSVSGPRTFHHSEFPAERLCAQREASISVCLPAREVAETIRPTLEALGELHSRGAIDQVLVVDAGSGDGTPEIAAGLGAEVRQEADLVPEMGPVLGKGDAMWRALSVLRGEIVCFLDADSEGFSAHFACGLLGPLLSEPGVELVKAAYRRPFRAGAVSLPDGGGRVTELTARPLLALFYPELAAFGQPLAGEVAGRRELLERIPFATGYAVEIAMLIDVWREVGLDGMAEVDLDVRHNRHQPLSALGPMASSVLEAVAIRLAREGRLADGAVATPAERSALVERPPMASLRAAGS